MVGYISTVHIVVQHKDNQQAVNIASKMALKTYL